MSVDFVQESINSCLQIFPDCTPDQQHYNAKSIDGYIHDNLVRSISTKKTHKDLFPED